MHYRQTGDKLHKCTTDKELGEKLHECTTGEELGEHLNTCIAGVSTKLIELQQNHNCESFNNRPDPNAQMLFCHL